MNIKECIEEMCRIEFKCKPSEMKKTYFFIDEYNNKLIIKNYDENIYFTDWIGMYLNIKDYRYLQYFSIGYTYNEFELIEFDIEEW